MVVKKDGTGQSNNCDGECVINTVEFVQVRNPKVDTIWRQFGWECHGANEPYEPPGGAGGSASRQLRALTRQDRFSVWVTLNSTAGTRAN